MDAERIALITRTSLQPPIKSTLGAKNYESGAGTLRRLRTHTGR